jgi:hypothetical protein
MELHVANCTRQSHLFAFRIIGTDGSSSGAAKTQPIGIGKQIRVSGNLDTPQADDIIRHHRNYGMLSVEELDRSRHVEWPLIYSTGKPIRQEVIERAMRHNMDFKIADGREIRRRLAVSVNQTIEDKLLRDRVPAELLETEMTIQEDRTGRSNTDLAQMSEGVRVSRTDADPHSPPKPVSAKARAGRRRAA